MALLPVFIVLLSFGQHVLSCSASNKVEKIEQQMNDVLSKLDQIWAKSCPVGRNDIYSIGSGCYAFDMSRKRTFADAQQYCSTVFGWNQRGKIHEPRSKLQQDEVMLKWKEFAGISDTYEYWLGITDNHSEGVWKYASDNQNISFNSWNEGYERSPSQNCGYQYWRPNWYDPTWSDISCNRQHYTSCELI